MFSTLVVGYMFIEYSNYVAPIPGPGSLSDDSDELSDDDSMSSPFICANQSHSSGSIRRSHIVLGTNSKSQIYHGPMVLETPWPLGPLGQ